MNTNELYLKTIFCCMACDGEIADEEIALLRDIAKKSEIFGEIDIQSTINGYVNTINKEGLSFLNSYLKDIDNVILTEEQAIKLIGLAIETIEADNNIEYSEISFFKKIRKRINITDNRILEVFPDKEDYLLPDIAVSDGYERNFSFKEFSI